VGCVPVGQEQQVGLARITTLVAVAVMQRGPQHRLRLQQERPVPGQQPKAPGRRLSRLHRRWGDGQHIRAMLPVAHVVEVLVVEHVQVALGDRPPEGP
jgi:hypothetical protein